MRRLGMVLAAVLLLTGCGSTGQSPATKAAASKSAAAEQAAKHRASAAAEAKVKATAVYKECSDATTPLDTALGDLNSRLSVGLPFAEYSNKVGDVRVAYDALVKIVDGPGVSAECLSGVATIQEKAFNNYVDAYDVWNKCVQDYNCSFDDGSDALKQAQANWSKAGTQVEKAEAGLAALQPA